MTCLNIFVYISIQSFTCLDTKRNTELKNATYVSIYLQKLQNPLLTIEIIEGNLEVLTELIFFHVSQEELSLEKNPKK